MFNRDIDDFKSPEAFNKYIAPGPHGQPPPSGPHPPPFMPFPAPPFVPPPPLIIDRDAFQDIRNFILLMIISEYPNGVTGYQLSEKHNFPRGTLLRTLQDFENEGYVESREEVIEGRENKFYTITKAGKTFLNNLRSKWATQFANLSAMAPPETSLLYEGARVFLIDKINSFKSKEDALDFYRGIRFWIKSMLSIIEKRKLSLDMIKSEVDKTIEDIQQMKTLNIEELKKKIEEVMQKIQKEGVL